MEFLLRRGSLETGRGLFAGAAMQEGARIHRMLQKKEGPGYKAEAALSREIEIDPGQLIAAGAPAEQEKKYILRLEGRADGIYHSGEESAGISQGDGGPAGISTDGKEPACICHSGKEAAGSISQGDGGPAGLWMIDEIKTVFRGFRDLREPEQVHLAQARCYAFIYAEKEGLDRIGIRMTYCSQVTGEVKRFYEVREFGELKAWFEGLIRDYIPWLAVRVSFEESRDRTREEMVFPFPYREGQYDLAAGVYRTIVHGRKLFLQAPTGTGKTMAVLFPALKAVGGGKADRIFYLTAKAVAGRAATEALGILKGKGLNIRSLVLTSRERICPCETVDCSPSHCSRADGHYDRVNAALRELLQEAAGGEPVTGEMISECAGRHRVCPYELSLDACDFADVIICDYNYAFHPEARLARFFGDPGNGFSAERKILLIDEAHNLLERGRDMYSASLSYREVRLFRKSIKNVWPRLWKKMKGLVRVLRLLETEGSVGQKTEEKPAGRAGQQSHFHLPSFEDRREELLDSLREVDDVIRWILEQERKNEALYETAGVGKFPEKAAETGPEMDLKPESGRRAGLGPEVNPETAAKTEREADPGPAAEPGIGELLEFYFGISHFRQMLEEMDEHYVVYGTGNGGSRFSAGGFSLHLYCADPSGKLKDCMAGAVSSILFSATFLPIQYYKSLLGGSPEDFEMYARSSFSPARRKVVIVNDVTSRYRNRNADNYERIARSIAGTVSCRPGNYLAFFPSYIFMESVYEAFCRICQIPQRVTRDAFDIFSHSAGWGRGKTALPDGDKSPDVPDRDALPDGHLLSGRPLLPDGPLLSDGHLLSGRPLLPDGSLLSDGPLFSDRGKQPVEDSLPADDLLTGDGGKIRVIAQKRRMEEAEKTAFLQAFEEVLPDRYLVGFCVMGGMFGEGIDLRDDRLIGTFVVGTGIPPVDSRREFLRDYFSKKGRDGYDFAYRFPGMNKVLQAAGRVIRTETDRGIVLLMDERFEERANRELFPVEWGCPPAMDSESAARDVRLFWEEQQQTESI